MVGMKHDVLPHIWNQFSDVKNIGDGIFSMHYPYQTCGLRLWFIPGVPHSIPTGMIIHIPVFTSFKPHWLTKIPMISPLYQSISYWYHHKSQLVGDIPIHPSFPNLGPWDMLQLGSPPRSLAPVFGARPPPPRHRPAARRPTSWAGRSGRRTSKRKNHGTYCWYTES